MKFFEALAQQFAGKPIDWDELEHALIRADLGVPLSTRIIKKLQERKAWSLLGISDVIKVAREEITKILQKETKLIQPIAGKPTVILVVGVNGTGKTTSVAKLAYRLQHDRHTVLLAAADTFRAAAIEQLGILAKRLGVEMVAGQYGADPATLCYDAYQRAENDKIDFLLCDTAGRLHTKANLIAELQKIKTYACQDRPAFAALWRGRQRIAARNPLSCRCDHRRQRAQLGVRVSSSVGSHRLDRDQARRQRQRRNRGRNPG